MTDIISGMSVKAERQTKFELVSNFIDFVSAIKEATRGVKVTTSCQYAASPK